MAYEITVCVSPSKLSSVLNLPSFSEVILKNWLLNPTGKANAFVPVDLVQEHLNYWIKVSPFYKPATDTLLMRIQVIYKAHGSAASWEWLEGISPSINILRKLSTQTNDTLGSRQGSKHAAPDLWKDIELLMDGLDEFRVYKIEHGRTIPGDNPEAVNVVEQGLASLEKPLREFNTEFRKQQRRRRRFPLIGEPAIPTSSANETSAPPPPTSLPMDERSTSDTPATASDVKEAEEEEEDAEGGETEGRGTENQADLDAEADCEDELLPRESEEDVEFDMDGFL